jgi:hypothetical protein
MRMGEHSCYVFSFVHAIPAELARIRLALLGSRCINLHMPLLAKYAISRLSF